MSSRGKRSRRRRRQLGQKKPRQAIVGGEKKNEVAWRILDVVEMMKVGVDKLVALVYFLGGSRVYFKRGGEATFFAGPGITAMRRQVIISF